MKHTVDAEEWEALKRRTAGHLSDPHWLGGTHCINLVSVTDRVELPTHHQRVRLSRSHPEASQ